jgi:hypothetical protein
MNSRAVLPMLEDIRRWCGFIMPFPSAFPPPSFAAGCSPTRAGVSAPIA